jgi:GxxExxY protein
MGYCEFTAERKEHKGGDMKDIRPLCDLVRQIAYDIHVYHGHGHLEKVYENALANRLKKAGLNVRQQHPIAVFDEDGTSIGEYFADLLVKDCLIVELKTARTLGPEHEAQTLGYLKSSRIEHGLVISFGSYKFEIRKFAWSESLQRKGVTIALAANSAFLAFAVN